MLKLTQRLGVSKSNTKLLYTTYFIFLANGMMSIMLGALLPLIREDIKLDYTQTGLMLSAHQIGNVSAVLLAGVLPLLLGRKKSTLLMGSGIIIGLTGMTITSNPFWLIIAFAFTGIGRGTMSNICNVIISIVCKKRTSALNLLHATFAVGALLSPVVILLATNLGFNWRGAALFVAALAFIALITLGSTNLSNSLGQTEKTKSKWDLNFLTQSTFWLHTGILFFYLSCEASIIGWFVTYFKEQNILPSAVAAFTPTFLWSMIMIGRILSAILTSKINKSAFILILGLLFTGFFCLMLLSSNKIGSMVGLLGIGLSMAGIYPTTFSSMGSNSSTIATGVCMGSASLGSIFMPLIIGKVADTKGLPSGISMIFFALFAMLLLMIIKFITYQLQRKRN